MPYSIEDLLLAVTGMIGDSSINSCRSEFKDLEKE